MSKLYILGEAHYNAQSRDRIEAFIRQHRPKFLLHELLYQDVALDRATIKKRLDDCRKGELCDPQLNRDIYQLGFDIGVGLVGIDLDNPPKTTIAEQFEAREQNMVRLIEQYRHKGDVVVVVGDIHLRSKANNTVRESPLYLNYRQVADVYDRAGKTLREIE